MKDLVAELITIAIIAITTLLALAIEDLVYIWTSL